MNKLKYATNGKHFQNEAKSYVINMHGGKRKLHKKNGCQHSHCFYEYYDFDTVEEAKSSKIEHTECKLCFKENK